MHAICSWEQFALSTCIVAVLMPACFGTAIEVNGACLEGNCAVPDTVNIGSSVTLSGEFVYTFANGDSYGISTTFPISPSAQVGGGVRIDPSASTQVTYLGNGTGGASANDVLTIDFLQNVQSMSQMVSAISGGYSIFGVLGGGIAAGSSFTTQYTEGGFLASPVLGPFVGPGSVSGSQPGFPISGTYPNPSLYDGRGTETFQAGSAVGSFIQLSFFPPATFDGLKGGPSSAPTFLVSASPIGSVQSVIGGLSSQDYYSFSWAGGAFNATASIAGANVGASYLFSEGHIGDCRGATETLNGSDNFMSTIAIPNLAPGQYCIGIDATSPNDPAFTLTFNTPVQGTVPEPSTLILVSVSFTLMVTQWRIKRNAIELAHGRNETTNV